MGPLALLLACAPRALPTPPLPEGPARVEAPAPEGPADPAFAAPVILAAGPCADRAWTREIELRIDGRFVARDLVSPCPPGTICVWSGVITRSGLATWREGALLLEVLSTGPGPAGVPFPDRLTPSAPGALADPWGCAWLPRRGE